jgi:hypothetical protein
MWSTAAGILLATTSTTLSQSASPTEEEAKAKAPAGQADNGKAPLETEGSSQQQPQGPTGPLETSSGGSPASSPQGDTPPGMQSDQHGIPADVGSEKRPGE